MQFPVSDTQMYKVINFIFNIKEASTNVDTPELSCFELMLDDRDATHEAAAKCFLCACASQNKWQLFSILRAHFVSHFANRAFS